jgi:hypothetical protein
MEFEITLIFNFGGGNWIGFETVETLEFDGFTRQQ